jgi:hypothetical protein
MKCGIVVRLDSRTHNVARRATLQVMLAFAALAFVLALVTYFIPVLVVCLTIHRASDMAAMAVPWHSKQV